MVSRKSEWADSELRSPLPHLGITQSGLVSPSKAGTYTALLRHFIQTLSSSAFHSTPHGLYKPRRHRLHLS